MANSFARFGCGAAVAAVLLVGAIGCGSDDGDRAPSSTALQSTSSTPLSTSIPPAPTSTVTYRPPYIDHVEWVQTDVGPSLQVHPTTSGRYTTDESAMGDAWSEVVRLDASANSPGMQAQFDCHWRFARIVDPEKASWNLEPRRPVVDEQTMIDTRCNPGFAEEN